MLLFVRILEKCGDSIACEINYEALKEETGLPAPTLKHWAANLEKQGFITKLKSAHGSHVEVHLEKLPLTEAGTCVTETPDNAAIDFIKGLRGTVIAACDGFLASRKAGAA